MFPSASIGKGWARFKPSALAGWRGERRTQSHLSCIWHFRHHIVQLLTCPEPLFLGEFFLNDYDSSLPFSLFEHFLTMTHTEIFLEIQRTASRVSLTDDCEILQIQKRFNSVRQTRRNSYYYYLLIPRFVH